MQYDCINSLLGECAFKRLYLSLDPPQHPRQRYRKASGINFVWGGGVQIYNLNEYVMNVTNHIVEAGFCQCKRMRGAGGVRCHIPRLRFYANKQCYESPTSGDQVQRLYHEVWLQLSSQCRFLFFMIMDILLRTHPVFPSVNVLNQTYTCFLIFIRSLQIYIGSLPLECQVILPSHVYANFLFMVAIIIVKSLAWFNDPAV